MRSLKRPTAPLREGASNHFDSSCRKEEYRPLPKARRRPAAVRRLGRTRPIRGREFSGAGAAPFGARLRTLLRSSSSCLLRQPSRALNGQTALPQLPLMPVSPTTAAVRGHDLAHMAYQGRNGDRPRTTGSADRLLSRVVVAGTYAFGAITDMRSITAPHGRGQMTRTSHAVASSRSWSEIQPVQILRRYRPLGHVHDLGPVPHATVY